MARSGTHPEPDPSVAWRREREHYHRARAARMILPGVPPVVLGALLVFGILSLPRSLLEIVLWILALVGYLIVWTLLIHDARKYVDAATEVDARYRAALGETPPAGTDTQGGVDPATGRARHEAV